MNRSDTAVPLEATQWTLSAVDGAAPVQTMRAAELHLADGRVSGSGGCNRLMGAYKISGELIDFSQVASTRMACPPPSMQLEQTVLRVLAAKPQYRITGSSLELSGDGIVLHFDAQEQ